MSSGSRFITGFVFVLVLTALGTADALLTQDLNAVPVVDSGSSEEGGESSVGGIPRESGADVFETLNAGDIVTETTHEESLLRQIVPENVDVASRVILKNNDRLAHFSWVESADAKVYFTALKEALHTSFSSELRDVVDETQEREGKPVRNVLSFLDPAIHEERILFVRVRQRLYEFHVAPGKEPEIQQLMDALTE